MSTERSKDHWDKVASITPLLLGLLVTGGAAIFGAIHNSKQDKLAEISALEKLQAKLNSEDPIEREFGYAVFAALGYEEIALRLIRLRQDKSAESVVTSIKQLNSNLTAEADATLKELREFQAPDGQKVKGVVSKDGKLSLEEGWEQTNIIRVEIPQLRGFEGATTGRVRFHKNAAADLQAAFAEIDQAKLLSRIKSWDGAYHPKMRPGGFGLGNHTWGMAFDINANFNSLGKAPAELGQEGSVVELVPIFAKYHFEWGGNYPRPDGMHFQWVPPERRQ